MWTQGFGVITCSLNACMQFVALATPTMPTYIAKLCPPCRIAVVLYAMMPVRVCMLNYARSATRLTQRVPGAVGVYALMPVRVRSCNTLGSPQLHTASARCCTHDASSPSGSGFGFVRPLLGEPWVAAGCHGRPRPATGVHGLPVTARAGHGRPRTIRGGACERSNRGSTERFAERSTDVPAASRSSE